MSEIFQKDVQIIRQSQIKLVYDFLMAKGINPSVELLQKVTDIFTAHCLKGPDEEMVEKVKKLDNWIEAQQAKQQAKNG